MNREIKGWWLGLSLLLIMGLAQTGCASSDAEPECEADFECAFPETCNTELGVCEEELRDDNNGAGGNNDTVEGGFDPSDAGDDEQDAGDDQVPDTETPDEEDSGDPNACEPACPAGQSCESGSCVPDSTEPTCTQKDEACDPQVVDQGSFWCAGDGNGGGECLPKCNEPMSATGCGLGEYCWNLGSESQPAPACIEAECQRDVDCPMGSCLNFDNQFGICLPSGATPEGNSCDPNAANTCQAGLMCRSEPSGSTTGICRTLCDPWDGTSCPSGQLCDLFTNRQGICVPEVDPMGSAPYESCTNTGDMCDHGVLCIGFTDGTSGCRPYCRPGMNDCPSAGSTPIVCNNYVVAGERTWGLCLGPACTSSADCGGNPCQGGVCRRSCSPGNEVQDCCGGNPDCAWSCVNGMCE